jgi:hypothetical protein
MISVQSQPSLPRCSLDRLAPIAPGLAILAFLSTSGHGSAAREVLDKGLAPLIEAPAIDATLPSLAADRLMVAARSGRCRITEAGRSKAEETLGPWLARPWSEVVGRALAPLALGVDPRDDESRYYFARRDNLEGAALACLYGLKTSSRMPSRVEVRFLFLRALVSARLPECESAFVEITMQNTLRDPVSRALMLGAAGLSQGTLRDAEGALLHKALGVDSKSPSAIAEALVRSALAKSAMRQRAPVQLPPLTLAQPKEPARADKAAADKTALADFATTVRDLARTQTTHPFAGRVAIAQVYDAGMQRGLNFGPLEAFKARIAEAGRAGLLDLERYDIAGPMDPALRDRSRTPFGRDVRHFIVNEWI